MKIIHQDPPNWNKIEEHFPRVKKSTVYVTYDGAIYTHSDVPNEIYDHECIHEEQQKEIGVEEWWNQYYLDPAFRYKMELPAYKTQIRTWSKANKDKNSQLRYRMAIAQILSGELYGKCVAYDKAFKDLI